MFLNHCRAACLKVAVLGKNTFIIHGDCFPRTESKITYRTSQFCKPRPLLGAINLLTNSITSAGAPRVLQQRTGPLDLNLTCHFKTGLPEKCRNFCQQHKNNLVLHSSKSCSEGARPRRLFTTWSSLHIKARIFGQEDQNWAEGREN